MLFSFSSNRRSVAFCSMLAVFGVVVRSGPAAVTAFSIAAYTTSVKASPRATTRLVPTAFGRRRTPSSTLLRQSTTAVASPSAALEKALDVTHPAYDVINKDVVEEYGCYCVLYRHKKSGAELLSVATEDDNKVFGITLRTPPEDSTGVPHILEHSVLCGSRKYKTKDPFVQLLQGSLQTFLNAMTFPDRTAYVVASQNEKDFLNLVNVYCDAVYHPRAIKDENVLAQEGWHYELENKEGPLTYKGVVYNEMKGVYSSPDSTLSRLSMRSVFPDNAYAVDSGGDPQAIPNLTYEEFVEFHRKFYSPTNSRIYFYGDDDILQRLELMDSYLSEFDLVADAREKSTISMQSKTITEPQRQISFYPAGSDQPETHMLTVNWLLNDKPLTSTEELTLGVLDHLLMGTTSSVLRKTLMESGLGEAITGGGLMDDLIQAIFSVGLKGVSPENVDNVEALILQTLEKIEKEGFEEDDIASSLNTIEFSMREFNTGSFPKGLSFMLGAMSKWIYDESPTEALKFEQPLNELKARIQKDGSKVFQDLIRDYLTQNFHRTTVELKPSKTLEDETAKEEQDRLAAIKDKMSDEDLANVMRKAEELRKLQAAEDSPEARATIPRLELSDIKRESIEFPIEVSKNENGSGITVTRHEFASTAGIAYVNFAVDLSVLPLEDVKLLPLFTRLMRETGAGEYDSVALSRRIGTHTGGVGVSTLTTASYSEGVDQSTASTGEHMITKLMIRGKATSDKADELFSIFHLILTEARFDSKAKVVELLKESRSRLQTAIQSSGHSMMNTRMRARYRVGGYIDEITGGISYLDTLNELIEQAENDWPSLLARLEKIRTTLLDPTTCRAGMIVDITGEEKVFDAIQPALNKFLDGLPGDSQGKPMPDFYKEKHPWVEEAKSQMAKIAPLDDEGFIVPTQVSYVGKAGLLYDEGETISGSSYVVSRFLRTGYLWDQVRVMGGAYGGFCTFSPFSSLFSFLSYRDPNLDKTLDVYDAAADALLEAADMLENDRDALETAIIGAIGDMDGAMSNDQKGYSAFQRWIMNETAEKRQQYRDEILNTTPSDFREFANRLKALKQPSVAVVSSKAAFESAAKAGKVMKLKEVF